MGTFIQDKKTGEYYAVACSENEKGYLSNPFDDGSPGKDDFPYWTKEVSEAYDFATKTLAKSEMEMNDLTQGGERELVIIFL